MLSNTIDVTTQFNANGQFNQDVGQWDYVIVQLVSPSGTINFLCSSDSGAIQGVTDGNATSATNFNAVEMTNLATNGTGTSAAASGSYKFNVVGRYLQLSGAGVTATKVLLQLNKIS
jgi:hypothetical protein